MARSSGKMRLVEKIIVAMIWLFALPANAEVWTADDFPVAYLRDSRQYVSDPDNVLSPAARDTINTMLGSLEATRGVQSLFAVARRIENGDPYEFGMALARKYGIGNKKQNSGLIVVLSTEDRAYYILTGNGLEGTLPDAICKRIENQYMVPYLSDGDWDTAMTNCAKAVCAYVAKDEALLPADKADDDEDAAIIALFLVLGCGIIVLIAVVANARRKSLCPKCHNHTLKPTGQTLRRTADGRLLAIYKCSSCGYTEAREDNSHDDSGSAAAFLPFLFMGGGRGGSFGGGGGFSGGTFGGGSFGGGGAGGKF